MDRQSTRRTEHLIKSLPKCSKNSSLHGSLPKKFGNIDVSSKCVAYFFLSAAKSTAILIGDRVNEQEASGKEGRKRISLHEVWAPQLPSAEEPLRFLRVTHRSSEKV